MLIHKLLEVSVLIFCCSSSAGFISAPTQINSDRFVNFTEETVPLVNPVVEPGSYEWSEEGSACLLNVYWENPSDELVKGQLIATEVSLWKAHPQELMAAVEVPPNISCHFFDMDSKYCSSSAPIHFIVVLRSKTRSGVNRTLAPTVLHVQSPQTQEWHVTKEVLQLACLNSASRNITCLSVSAAFTVIAPPVSPVLDSLLSNSAVLYRPLLCKNERSLPGNVSGVLKSLVRFRCFYGNNCITTINVTEKSVRIFCNLTANITMEKQLNFDRIGFVVSWNSTTTKRFQFLNFQPISAHQRSLASMASVNKAPDFLFYKWPEKGPLNWFTFTRPVLKTPCPQKPVSLIIDNIEPYNFFEGYRAKVKWTSTTIFHHFVNDKGASLESKPVFFELFWMRTEEPNSKHIKSICENSIYIGETLRVFKQGERVWAHQNYGTYLSEKFEYEQSITGLEPSLTGGGNRYRIYLHVYDIHASRVTRLTLVFPVVGWPRGLVIASVVLVVLLLGVIVGLCGIARYYLLRRLVKKTRQASKLESTAPTDRNESQIAQQLYINYTNANQQAESMRPSGTYECGAQTIPEAATATRSDRMPN